MLLNELGMEKQGPIETYCDNKDAIYISYKRVHHNRIKHVETDRHFIKEKVDEGVSIFITSQLLRNSIYLD